MNRCRPLAVRRSPSSALIAVALSLCAPAASGCGGNSDKEPVLHLRQRERPAAFRWQAQPSVDLLYLEGASVSVSSTEEDSPNVPAYLVDGSFDTAWKSKRGESVGAWIRVKVPKERYLERLSIALHESKKQQSANRLHVRVSMDDASLGEFDVTSKSGEPVAIAIQKPGGTLRIDVVGATDSSGAPSSQIAVTDLRVIGYGALPVYAPPTSTKTNRRAPTMVLPPVAVNDVAIDEKRSIVFGPFSDVSAIHFTNGERTIGNCSSPGMVLASTADTLPQLIDAVVAQCDDDVPHLALRIPQGWYVTADPIAVNCDKLRQGGCLTRSRLVGDVFHAPQGNGVRFAFFAAVSGTGLVAEHPAKGALDCIVDKGHPRCSGVSLTWEGVVAPNEPKR